MIDFQKNTFEVSRELRLERLKDRIWFYIKAVIIFIFWVIFFFLVTRPNDVHAQVVQPAKGLATYYTHASTIKEGNSGIMANGKRMDDGALTAASWFYPLGSKVKITSQRTRRSVVCTITDRGPSKRLVRKGKIIDLSAEAFKKLAQLKVGVVKVQVEEVTGND